MPERISKLGPDGTQAIAILGARGIEQKSILDNKREMTAQPEVPKLRTVFLENFPISYAAHAIHKPFPSSVVRNPGLNPTVMSNYTVAMYRSLPLSQTAHLSGQ